MKRASIFAAIALIAGAQASAQWGGSLRFCIRAEPKTFHPLEVDDEASELVRYLTGGVLIRINRYTQDPVPGLAVSWKISDGGAKITFHLRHDVRFTSGRPMTSADFRYAIERVPKSAITVR